MKEKKKGGKERELHRERKFLKQLKQYTLNHLHQGHLLYFKSSESFREGRDVENEIFEALKRVAIVGEGLEETLQGFQKQFSPLTLTFCHY